MKEIADYKREVCIHALLVFVMLASGNKIPTIPFYFSGQSHRSHSTQELIMSIQTNNNIEFYSKRSIINYFHLVCKTY